MKRSLSSTVKGGEKPGAGHPEAVTESGVREMMNKYSGMSESELMRELLSVTAKQKAEGNFDAGSLERGVNTLLPMLNEEQKRKLYGILGKL